MRNAYSDMLRRRIIMQMRNHALCVRKTRVWQRICVEDENIYGARFGTIIGFLLDRSFFTPPRFITIETRPITDMRFYVRILKLIVDNIFSVEESVLRASKTTHASCKTRRKHSTSTKTYLFLLNFSLIFTRYVVIYLIVINGDFNLPQLN